MVSNDLHESCPHWAKSSDMMNQLFPSPTQQIMQLLVSTYGTKPFKGIILLGAI